MNQPVPMGAGGVHVAAGVPAEALVAEASDAEVDFSATHRLETCWLKWAIALARDWPILATALPMFWNDAHFEMHSSVVTAEATADAMAAVLAGAVEEALPAEAPAAGATVAVAGVAQEAH